MGSVAASEITLLMLNLLDPGYSKPIKYVIVFANMSTKLRYANLFLRFRRQVALSAATPAKAWPNHLPRSIQSMCKAEAELRGTEKSNPVKRFGVLCGTFKPVVSLRYLADIVLPDTALKDWRTINTSVKAPRL